MSGRILIIDGVATNRIVLMARLQAACYDAVTAADGANGLDVMRRNLPNLVLLNGTLPDMPGTAVLARIRSNPGLRDVPVVMLMDDLLPDQRLELIRAGADDALPRAIDPNWLLARARALMRSRAASRLLRAHEATLGQAGMAERPEGFDHPGLVAIVAEKYDVADALLQRLEPHQRNRLVALTRSEALNPRDAGQLHIDAFLLAASPGNGEATLRLMSELRTRGAAPEAEFCVLLQDAAGTAAINALNMDAQDVLDRDCPAEEIAFRLDRMIRRKKHDDRRRKAIDDGLRYSVIDPLTGLHNMRFAEPELDRLIDLSRRQGTTLAVMVIDLDRFKSVNDIWGHPTGNAVLVEVARRLKAALCPRALLARMGGEEFIVALPDCDPDLARATAQRLCAAVKGEPFKTPSGQSIPITVSLGWSLSMPDRPEETRLNMVERADQALLMAKAAGRNRAIQSRSAA